jgi:thiamine kinase-like enzyme
LGLTAWVSQLGSTSCRTYDVENSGIGGFASVLATERFYPALRVQNPCDDVAVTLPGPEEIAHRLLGRDADEIRPLVVWDHRATYRCRIGREEFVCKADENLAELGREVDGHSQAAAAGIPVPEIIAAESGLLAMRWVEGVALCSDSSDESWRAAAAVLQRIHELPAPAHTTGGLPRAGTWLASIEEELETELPNIGLAPEQAQRLRDAVAERRAALVAAPRGFCHGDLQPDHVLLDPATQREVVAIIDWSDYGAGHPTWDIAVLTLDDEERTGAFTDASDLVDLYRAIRDLGEVRWLIAHRMHDAADHARRRLAGWRQ